jgi:hypothetical protein
MLLQPRLQEHQEKYQDKSGIYLEDKKEIIGSV